MCMLRITGHALCCVQCCFISVTVSLFMQEVGIVNRNANRSISYQTPGVNIIILHSHPKAESPISPIQYAEGDNLSFHSMTHWYQHHQSAAFLQKVSYYFRSVSLFSSWGGAVCRLSTHKGTLLVLTTFMLERLTVCYNMRMNGRQLCSMGF